MNRPHFTEINAAQAGAAFPEQNDAPISLVGVSSLDLLRDPLSDYYLRHDYARARWPRQSSVCDRCVAASGVMIALCILTFLWCLSVLP